MNCTTASDKLSIQTRRQFNWSTALVGIAIIGGTVIRWIWLGKASLWYDEGYTAWIVSHPASEIIRLIRADTAPPLYYLLLRAWVNCFGHSEAGLRSLSALISTLILVGFYPLAVRITRNRWTAALALMLLALSYMQVEHGREARFYPLMTLLAELNVLLILMAIERRAIWKYVALIIVWAMSMYTNNMMAFYLGGMGLAWLVLPGTRSLRGRVFDLAVVSILAAVLFLPWVPTMLAQTHSLQGHFWARVPARPDLTHALIQLAGANRFALGDFRRLNARVAIGFIVLVVCTGLARCETRHQTIALAAIGFLPVFSVFFYSQVRQSIFVDRSFIASTLVLPLIFVLPVPRLRQKLGIFAVLVYAGLLIVPSLLSVQLNHLTRDFEDWRSACIDISDHPAGRQLFVFVGNEGELLYDYYVRQGDYSRALNTTGAPIDFFDLDPPHTMQRVRSPDDLASVRQALAAHRYDQVVLVDCHYWWSDSNHETRKFLDRTLSRQGEAAFGSIVVYRWSVGAVTIR